MSSPQSFMTVPAPNLQQQVPQINFAQGLEEFYKSRAANAFAGGIPMKDGQPDTQEILKRTFQAGGAPAAQALLPYLLNQGQGAGDALAIENANRAANGLPPLPPLGQQQQFAAPATVSPSSAANATDQAGSPAAIHGGQPQQSAFKGTGSEFDPFVIPDERALKFFQSSDNFPKGAHWVLSNSGWTGTKGEPGATRSGAGPTPPLGKVSPIAREKQPESGQPTAGPENAPGATPDQMAAARERLKQGLTGGDGGSVSGAPGPVATPGGRSPISTQPKIGAGPTGAVPAPGTLPPEATPQPRQPIAPAADPALADPQAIRMRTAIAGLEQRALEAARMPGQLGKDRAEQLSKAADRLKADYASHVEVLRKQQELSPTEKEAARAGQSPADYEARKAAEIETAKKAPVRLEAIQGGALQYTTDLQPHIETAESLINRPGLWTGFGSHASLDFNRAKALVGYPNAAQAQEAFQKSIGQMKLGLINIQKTIAAEGGQQAGRIFAQTVRIINESTASLGNTLAGNRFLIESMKRTGVMQQAISKFASDYASDPRGPGYLDAKFNNKLAEFIAQRPMFTTQERKFPELVGAPRAPPNIKDQAELFKWQHDMGLNKGDAYRRADGSYGSALTPRGP